MNDQKIDNIFKKLLNYSLIILIIMLISSTPSYAVLSPLNAGELWGVSRTKINNNLTDLETRKMDESVYDANTDGVIDTEALPPGTYVESGVYAFLSEPAQTTITTAETYYPINGTFTNGPVESFSAAVTHTPGIKYDGSTSQFFEVDWHASLSVNSSGTTVKLGIEKNGSLVGGSVMGHFLKNANESYSLSGTCVVELDENDEIQLVITSDGSGDITTMNYYTTTIREFFN